MHDDRSYSFDSPPGRRGFFSTLWRVCRVLIILGIWGGTFVAALGVWFGHDLPHINLHQITTRRPSITLLSCDHKVFANYGDFYGGAVSLKEMSPYLPKAVVAIEDRRFYAHWGVDPIGLIRAAFMNYRRGHVVQGGSTITQQLAKNFLQASGRYHYTDRSIRRKIQEVLLALWLEYKFTKDHILTIYLNRVYLGGGAWGVNAAAHRYFVKPAAGMTLLESAILAGLLKAPSRYNPLAHTKRSLERAQVVLKLMTQEGSITDAQATQALTSSLKSPLSSLLSAAASSSSPYFADWVLESLPNFVNQDAGDLIVVTTLDPGHQHIAETAVEQIIAQDQKALNIHQGALVSMRKDGAVTAMVGGRHYATHQFNRVTALRQPGSTFKVFIFLKAFEQGMLPADSIEDTPLRIGSWTPRNYKWISKGEISLEEAFAHSVNTAAVRLAEKIGIPALIQTARRLGISTPLEPHLSLALGSAEVTLLELTSAYGIFANDGKGILPYGIKKVYNRRGDILYERQGSGTSQLVSPIHVALMDGLLQSVMTYGSGKSARLERRCAAKSGTSQNHRDAWFIGYTDDYIVGVWGGNDDCSPMKNITGGKIPAKIWKYFMTHIGQR